MRTISSEKIREAVSALCIKANFQLRPDVVAALRRAQAKELRGRPRRMLDAIVENAHRARRERLAICQDTGLAAVFVDIGQDVRVQGDLKRSIAAGIESGYRKGFLRASIVKDPLARTRAGFAPPVFHFEVVAGDRLTITVLPKGFGCENKTRLTMLNPTASVEDIKDFVIETIRAAGPDACPPYVIGVGIGGTAEYACVLAKKALLKMVPRSPGHRVAGLKNRLEKELLDRINALGIGPMGLGGRTTALAVNIATYPTHIAGLPVCVSVSCHALRSARAVL